MNKRNSFQKTIDRGSLNIFVVSNISSIWRGDRSASYTYDCDTGRVTLNSGVNPITNYLVVR